MAYYPLYVNVKCKIVSLKYRIIFMWRMELVQTIWKVPMDHISPAQLIRGGSLRFNSVGRIIFSFCASMALRFSHLNVDILCCVNHQSKLWQTKLSSVSVSSDNVKKRQMKRLNFRTGEVNWKSIALVQVIILSESFNSESMQKIDVSN